MSKNTEKIKGGKNMNKKEWDVYWESQELHNHGETKVFHRYFQAYSREDALEQFYQSCRQKIELVSGIEEVVSTEEYTDAIYLGAKSHEAPAL